LFLQLDDCTGTIHRDERARPRIIATIKAFVVLMSVASTGWAVVSDDLWPRIGEEELAQYFLGVDVGAWPYRFTLLLLALGNPDTFQTGKEARDAVEGGGNVDA
jgi:hypothetical protein